MRGCLVLLVLLSPLSTTAQSGPCKEQCEARRKKLAKKLAECLEDVDPMPRDRAAKMRLLCRQHYVPPKCDGAPPCSEVKPRAVPTPYLRLSPIVFSAKRRGPELKAAHYAVGSEVFLRVDAEVLAKPKASRLWIALDLALLAVDARGKTHEVIRWDGYAAQERFITPGERGLPQRFTLHGGARLTADQTPGRYQMEVRVKEKGSGFTQTMRGDFRVSPR